MDIQLGKRYKTRGNGVVKIENINYSSSYPFFGVIRTEKGSLVRVASFNIGGMYLHHKQTEFDIIGEE